ncbi:DUF4954 family protein [Candidatus Fermentibacteria bacterium]|nr:DUF4954 family protein [Candidatus Fermentibacteria bacterium]
MRTADRNAVRELAARAAALTREGLSSSAPPAGWKPLPWDLVQQLESRGVSSPDWNGIQVSGRCSLDGISETVLEGPVRLDLAPGSRLQGSKLSCCDLHGVVRVVGTREISGYVLHDGCAVERCGSVTWREGTASCLDAVMQLGVETGERSLALMPGLSVELAWLLTGPSRNLMKLYDLEMDDLRAMLTGSLKGLIGPGAVLRSVPVVENTVVGRGCVIDNACAVRDVVMLGGSEEGSRILDGALVRRSALQWSATADSGCIIEESLVGEHSRVERQALLSGSLLGPDCVHGQGEITASLVGPLTSTHHQSLLIAARWPGGCGNVGYGANVGSNHTSRLPDQEASLGCGVFLGLGCSVKYPSSIAAGTMVATGTVLPPQRIEYPFSLVSEAADGCELCPGWVLSSNLFSLLRNLSKYRARRKASREPLFETPVNPVVTGQVITARNRLVSVSGRKAYKAPELEGAGACYVTEIGRQKGIAGYTMFLRWQCLDALLVRLEGGAAPGGAEELDDLVAREFPGLEPPALMARYVELLGGMLELVIASRSRDFVRGSSVIDDYAEIHSPPAEDRALEAVLEELRDKRVRASALSGG